MKRKRILILVVSVCFFGACRDGGELLVDPPLIKLDSVEAGTNHLVTLSMKSLQNTIQHLVVKPSCECSVLLETSDSLSMEEPHSFELYFPIPSTLGPFNEKIILDITWTGGEASSVEIPVLGKAIKTYDVRPPALDLTIPKEVLRVESVVVIESLMDSPWEDAQWINTANPSASSVPAFFDMMIMLSPDRKKALGSLMFDLSKTETHEPIIGTLHLELSREGKKIPLFIPYKINRPSIEIHPQYLIFSLINGCQFHLSLGRDVDLMKAMFYDLAIPFEKKEVITIGRWSTQRIAVEITASDELKHQLERRKTGLLSLVFNNGVTKKVPLVIVP